MAAVVLTLAATFVPGVANAGTTEPPVPTSPPTVTGDPVFRGELRAEPGTWEPAEGLTFSYQWLRAGDPIDGAPPRRYVPRLDDIRARLSVVVTATDSLGQPSEPAVSEPTTRVRKAELELLERPGVTGTRRWTRRLTADTGDWRQPRVRTSFRWLRDGTPIDGATRRRYRLDHTDVGHRVQVRVTARKEGYRTTTATSRRGPRIGHLRPVRRTATYRIETRGHITARMKVFRRQVAETFADPRGWRSAGVAFRRVSQGGDFSVVLAEASEVPRFSSVCSAQWSCRVGRYVIINQTRWKHASPSWNSAGQPLRGYRHMVVNHETGHWLGHAHRGCTGRGDLAPVMQQQSKGLDGCRHNPWPLASERWYD
ncbi:DUF3152 domain-containing protein [Nocardioides aestuarii]|uniref:DUF3152 domain-containing protein n=1 Tax=Nocardioides aestuarii TaxID=252231 RepID=A0ABW4TFK7_9ACTN